MAALSALGTPELEEKRRDGDCVLYVVGVGESSPGGDDDDDDGQGWMADIQDMATIIVMIKK